MIVLFLFLFLDIKGYGNGYSISDVSYPFSLYFEDEIVRPYFSFNTIQKKEGIFIKDGLYSFAYGFNIDSVTSLKTHVFTLSKGGDIENKSVYFLSGRKFTGFVSGYLGAGTKFFNREGFLFLLTGGRLKIENPVGRGFIEPVFIGPEIERFSFDFILRSYIEPVSESKIRLKKIGLSLGEFDTLFLGAGFEVSIYNNFSFGLSLLWKEYSTLSSSLYIEYKTLFIEKTDYSFIVNLTFLPEGRLNYGFGITTFIGDERWKDKLREKRKKEREKIITMYREAKQKFKGAEERFKEIEKLKQEIEKKKRELDSLLRIIQEKEKKVEKMREEALEALKKIEGIKIREEKEYIKITATEKAIHFEIGGTGFTVNSIITLKKIAQFLKTYPGYKVRVEGHTDNIPIGPLLKKKFKDNMELSEARARAVVEYFTKVENLKNIKFEYKGFGETKPIADNSTEEGRAKNRRVEIYIEKIK